MKKMVNGTYVEMTADEIKARQDEEAAWATKKAAIKTAEENKLYDLCTDYPKEVDGTYKIPTDEEIEILLDIVSRYKEQTFSWWMVDDTREKWERSKYNYFGDVDIS